MAAKRTLTVRERALKNEKILSKLSAEDRAEVIRQSKSPFRLPITGVVLPHSRTKAIERAVKELVGQPGAFQSKPKGDIRVSRRKKK